MFRCNLCQSWDTRFSPKEPTYWDCFCLGVTTSRKCGGLAQSVECVVSNDEAPGSKPGFSTYFFQKAPHAGLEPATPGLEVRCASHCASGALLLSKSTFGGARTRDHKIKSLALYHLSYEGSHCWWVARSHGSYSLVVRTPRCDRGDPGSNPGRGTILFHC